MDRFRFRAWHKHYQEMISIREIFFYDSDHKYQGVTSEGRGQIHKDECVLMQSTSLKDKNGKLIFEGDILANYPEELDDDRDLWIVEFGEGSYDSGVYSYIGFRLRLISTDDFDGNANIIFGSDIEVIGNIHENPELLKKKGKS